MIEHVDHPYFIGTQAHPEFKSRPDRPHPLFDNLIKAAVERQRAKQNGPRNLTLLGVA
jgi:CTP synthase